MVSHPVSTIVGIETSWPQSTLLSSSIYGADKCLLCTVDLEARLSSDPGELVVVVSEVSDVDELLCEATKLCGIGREDSPIARLELAGEVAATVAVTRSAGEADLVLTRELAADA